MLKVSIFFLLAIMGLSTIAQTAAFPGAEGFGKYAHGARGGEVYVVTTLIDSGAGSFIDAISKPNRTIVFEVGGVIHHKNKLVFAENLTIAGQTAPGEGITLAGNGVSFTNANHMICRYIRFRLDSMAGHGKDAIGIFHGHDMIFDHITVSWGTDENFSISSMAIVDGPVHITVQNSIIAYGLKPHSCGGLIQSDGGITLFRNLYANNHTRNVKAKGRNQFVNNVVFNWGAGAYILGGSEHTSNAEVYENYFIKGPNTKSKVFTRGNKNFNLYASNNYFDKNQNGKSDGQIIEKEAYGTVTWHDGNYSDYPVLPAKPAIDAYSDIIASVGTSFPQRDEIDSYLIKDMTTPGGGKIISSEKDLPVKITEKRWSRNADNDKDRDGIPNIWETQHGLNPNNKEDAATHSLDANYTNIEIYINGIIEFASNQR